tara:strand:+ start:400 stop:564 length:165 start_codon:yes stop_codon:yes gene_type:complete
MNKPQIHFATKAGEQYFEYEREDGSRFLSIIAPEEWNLDVYGLKFIQSLIWKNN